jgi:hypothetical protein
MPSSIKPLPHASQPPTGARRSEPAIAGVAETSESAPRAPWHRLFSARWWIGLAAIALVSEAAIIFWIRSKAASPELPVTNEIVLGTFEFNRSNGRENRAYRGQFDLSIRLAGELTPADRRRVADQRPELQRAAEEALWRLRPVDFTDRRLTRLKARLQQQLNDAVGFDAIAEILISNFTIEARALPAAGSQRVDASADSSQSN